MLDDREVEVRCGVNINAIVFEQLSKEVIVDIEEKELDLNKVYQLPSLVGYIVKAGDTLWDIAKRFYTTIDQIKSVNNLEDTYEPKEGEKILIIKNIQNLIE